MNNEVRSVEDVVLAGAISRINNGEGESFVTLREVEAAKLSAELSRRLSLPLMPPLLPAAMRNVAQWIESGCDPAKAATELRLMADQLEKQR